MKQADSIDNENFEQMLLDSWSKEDNTEFEIHDLMRKCNVKEAAWAEELVSYCFAAYLPGSPDFKSDKMEGRVRRFGILFETKNPDKPISCCGAYVSEERNVVYIDEPTINKCWKHIARNVRRAKLEQRRAEKLEDGTENTSTSEDYVPVLIDLSALKTEKRKPYIKKYQVQYEVIPPSLEMIAQQGRKQRLLDDKKMRYYFEDGGNIYHDRDCSIIKNLKLDHFNASAEPPEGYSPCQVCGQKMLLRIACDPYLKQIPNVAWFMNQYKVSLKKLGRYIHGGMKFQSDSPSELKVKGKEDSWIIKRLDDGGLQLWHNNYERLNETERYIYGGYHYQKISGHSLVTILNYIEQYTWERHLEGEARKLAADQAEMCLENAAENKDAPEMVITEQKSVKKENIIMAMLHKIRHWLGAGKRMMSREQNISVFKDTERLCKANSLLMASINNSIAKQDIIFENDMIGKIEKKYTSPADIVVSRKRTLEAASYYRGAKIAVLNFASWTNPGGGVVNGATAQEESICRCSTLYSSLISPETMDDFYYPHQRQNNPVHNGDAIYTPDVTVFKTDDAAPKLLNEADWYNVNVITCAAPNLRQQPSNVYNRFDGENAIALSESELYEIHVKRLRRILDIAAMNENEVVILGAFGCGAFRNDPAVVARASKNVIQEYTHVFKTIEFAVYCSTKDDTNYKIFYDAL